ncbi:MAG: iron-containing redox enzyme family protein [Planctomycetales bacterium]|nr:MAG: iron-containing redox enzyme family protein [Planctomycetales bacterium]
MNAQEFVIELEEYATNLSRDIIDHPFIKAINRNELSSEALKFFTREYYFVSTSFVKGVAFVAANVPDDETRSILITNLWEEHGSGDISNSHRNLFKRFAHSVGVSVDELNTYIPTTLTLGYVEKMISVCRDTHFLTGLGALGPGTEYFTAPEYKLIAEGLMKRGLTEKDVEFWLVHAEWDDDHYSDIMRAIAPWVETSENQELVKLGTHDMIALEVGFWGGLWAETQQAR